MNLQSNHDPALCCGSARYPSEGLLHDVASRRRRADKILAILDDALGDNIESLRCLDIGCASGLVTERLARRFELAIGLEYDARSLSLRETFAQHDARLIQADALELPFGDASIDVVICAQVYEHVANAEQLASEIHRVLGPKGVCFFSGPNRLDPIERHYGLPFLSLLPRSMASALLRWTGKGEVYDISPRTWWGLRRLWRRFAVTDYTVEMIRHPGRYHCRAELGSLSWIGRLPQWLLSIGQPLFPNYNWVLRKREVA